MRRKILIAVLIAAIALAIYTYNLMSGAERVEYTIHIYRALMGPVTQHIPGNESITVNVTIYYPDLLYYRGPGRGLGTVNMTICTSWKGPWDGLVSVIVVDPNYRIDPTTFKPVEWEWRWAEGGAALGSGTLHAPINPVTAPCVNVSVDIWPSDRYFNMTPGVTQAQYFFKVRLAFFSPRTGEKIPGGDVNIYTTSKDAPLVRILRLPEEKGQSSLAYQLLFNTSVAVSLAIAIYLIIAGLRS